MQQIEKIEVFQSRIPLKKPFVISLEKLTHAENIIVAIYTSGGITGFGECSPFKTINGESMETAWLVSNYLAKVLLHKNALDIEHRISEMDKVIYANSSIKSAFDIALHDIASQHAGLPLYAFLGGKNNKILQTDYTVSLGEPDEMAVEAGKIKDAGFEIIKVKLGENGRRDVERIRLIREKIGVNIPLRLDANQGWDFETAAKVLRKLSKYNIQFCEEPIPRWDFMRLCELKNSSPIPVMADESVCDHHDAERLIQLNAVTHFNVKLGKSSGIFKAQKIAVLAEKAGILLQVGGFLESRLAFTASAHLAVSGKQIHYVDFDTPLMLEADPVEGGITYSPNGTITIPDTPGLGAKPNCNYLAGLPVKTFV
jgi:L-alanine-DL-glutamate epimerase-like enolase superfamily enzyme